MTLKWYGQVRKAPDIAETHTEWDTWQNELDFRAPLLSFSVDAISRFLRWTRWLVLVGQLKITLNCGIWFITVDHRHTDRFLSHLYLDFSTEQVTFGANFEITFEVNFEVQLFEILYRKTASNDGEQTSRKEVDDHEKILLTNWSSHSCQHSTTQYQKPEIQLKARGTF